MTPDPNSGTAAATRPVMTRGLLVLLTVMGGLAVSNLYWAQPLLALIADDLGVSTGTAGLLVTATQLSYAVGILLLVPLGDVLNRRRMLPVLLVGSAVALTACAVAPTFPLLVVAISLLGLSTVAGQVAIPLAGDLAQDADRGRVVGTVMSGFLAGTLVSRTLSGLVAQAAGWRAVFVLAAVLALVLAVLAWRRIPTLAASSSLSYPALLASILTLVRQHRVVRWTLVLGALQFAVFLMFWTSLTLLLSEPPFSYPVLVIGLFSLLGLFGVVASQRTGRLADRGWSLPATGVAWTVALVAVVVAVLSGERVVGIALAIVLLHLAIFPLNVLNSARLFALAPEARSRVNTAVIVVNFLAGAVGSAAVAPLWSAGGWRAVTLAELVLCVAGLAVWAVGRRGPLLAPARTHTAVIKDS